MKAVITQGQTFAVAASILLAAAVFEPARDAAGRPRGASLWLREPGR